VAKTGKDLRETNRGPAKPNRGNRFIVRYQFCQ